MEHSIKAFIFDLDGVIVDTARFHFESWQSIAKSDLGIELPAEFNEKLKGLGRMESLEQVLEFADIELDAEEKSRLTEKKNTLYLEGIDHLSEGDALPGVISFLKASKDLGLLIAIGSGSKNARPILKRLGITEMFDAICDGTDITRSKPDPEVFQCGCKKLNVDPGDAVVFEDAISGIEAALACGTKAIGVGEADVLDNAEIVISGLDGQTPSDILKQLSK